LLKQLNTADTIRLNKFLPQTKVFYNFEHKNRPILLTKTEFFLQKLSVADEEFYDQLITEVNELQSNMLKINKIQFALSSDYVSFLVELDNLARTLEQKK
jgi:hypothetical protein